MVNSMTGYASDDGADAGRVWTWELRGVNARGFDLRLRLPDAVQSLEPELRKRIASRIKRGSVQVGLRLRSEAGAGAGLPDAQALAQTVAAISAARDALTRAGLTAAAVDPLALLSAPGVLGDREAQEIPTAAILSSFDTAMSGFVQARAQEGAALAGVISGQIDTVAALVAQAQSRAQARSASLGQRFQAQVTELVELAGQVVDSDRLSHELAAMTVKGDVSEEIDRLTAHIEAARALVNDTGPIGRKLDFLMQEFNREANTLCSKSSDTELTRVGLDLKVVIDQMREQVQNLE